MSEIYVNAESTVSIDVGHTTNPDPTASLVRDDNTTLALAVAQQNQANGPAVETWVAEIPIAETLGQKTLKVVWTVDDGTTEYQVVKYLDVVTPYVTIPEICSRLGYQYSVEGDPGYQSLDRLVAAEKVARSVVERYTNNKFGKEFKTKTGSGQQVDVLTLPEPILSIKRIYENDSLIYDVDDDVNLWGTTFKVSDSGFGVRISEPGIDYTEEERPSLVYSYGNFRYGHRYDVYGEYGFLYVPQDVKEAMFYIIHDLLCQDAVYRTRYINHVQVKDWKFSFDDRAFSGTGNALANTLLENYRVFSAWVV